MQCQIKSRSKTFRNLKRGFLRKADNQVEGGGQSAEGALFPLSTHYPPPSTLYPLPSTHTVETAFGSECPAVSRNEPSL